MTNPLFNTLLRSIYAVDEINGQFLADLTRPLPFKWSRRESTGNLAILPGVKIRNRKMALVRAKGSVTRLKKKFAWLLSLDKVDTDEDRYTTERFFSDLQYSQEWVREAELNLSRAFTHYEEG